MTVDLTTGDSHARCMAAGEHICQEPSGQVCVEYTCDAPAGTWWGPNWCPEHDKERLDRIGQQLEEIRASLAERTDVRP